MKNTILILTIVLFAVGCSKKIQTGMDGTPQFVLAAGDLASPIDIVTNGEFVMTKGGMNDPSTGRALIEYATNRISGMTGFRFKLTAAKIEELRKFVHYVQTCAMDGSARAEVLVGPKVVFDSPDFRISGNVWIAGGVMTLAFQSPEEAQSVAAALTKR